MCPCVPVSGMSLACRGFWGSTFSVIICVPALCVSVCLFLCLWDVCSALLLVEVENRKVAAASLCLSRDHRSLGSSPGQESCWTRWLFLKFLTSSSSSHHVWQVDLGWLPGTQTTVLSLSLPHRTGRENKTKNFVVQHKGREIIHRLSQQAKQT